MQIRAAAGKKLPLIEQTPICRLAGRTHFETFFRTASLQNLNCNPARVNFSKNFFERSARPRSALKKTAFTAYGLYIKQVGTPTKARAGFIKMGCLQEWEASVGFVFRR